VPLNQISIISSEYIVKHQLLPLLHVLRRNRASTIGHVRSFSLDLEMKEKRSKKELLAGVRAYWT
jgi:hypothetical protein